MGGFVQPTDCAFRKFLLKGTDVRQHVRQFNIYETISKPYFTGKAVFIDNQNVLDNLNIVPGDKLEFVMDLGYGKIREGMLHVLNTDEPSPTQSLRAQHITMNFIDGVYYKDQASLVQHAFGPGIIGTQAIASLAQQYLGESIKVLSTSLGPLSKESHVISSLKPFTAINRIKEMLTYAESKTGTTLFFKDKEGLVLAPLEKLFQQLSPQQTFIQKATWGANWYDIAEAFNSVIAVTVTVDPEKNGGSRGSGDRSVAKIKQEQQVFDLKTKKLLINKMASQVGLGKLAGSAASIIGGLQQFANISRHGGVPNYHVMDSAKFNPATHSSVKAQQERLYQSMVKNGPMVTIKVPIQSGIDCTVGKGINAKLLPPAGDYSGYAKSLIGGLMLVTDLCHEFHNTDKKVKATTTMRCAKGGMND